MFLFPLKLLGSVLTFSLDNAFSVSTSSIYHNSCKFTWVRL